MTASATRMAAPVVQPGHPGAGHAEESGGEFLRNLAGAGLAGGPSQEVRQVACLPHPDGHRPVAGVVG